MAEKLRRIRLGGAPRVLDLFSGCGGFSLGMAAAGYEALAGLDADPAAAETWWFNFRPEHTIQQGRMPAHDITALNPADFFRQIGLPGGELGVDVICGGPPCQAYSRIGKGKLRSLGGPDAHLSDDRGALYEDLVRFVKLMRPLAVVIENVPDSANFGGKSIPDALAALLSESGLDYECRWTILNAVDYGVPQYRDRVFVVGIHRSVGVIPDFPVPSHPRQHLRKGQPLSRRLAAYQAMSQRSSSGSFFVMPPSAGDDPLPPVFASDALDDLPKFSGMPARGRRTPGCPQVGDLLPYNSDQPRNAYQALMRTWPGFETDGWVSGNMIRNTPRDVPLFARMQEGDQYPNALRIAEALQAEKQTEQEQKLRRKLSASELQALRRRTVPPYAEDKFQSKWSMLYRQRPSHAIVAHLAFDSYSHIHYDCSQSRTISIREAARLQSFPDGFRFFGNMGDAFRQIGNAVPPLLAMAVATQLATDLRDRSMGGDEAHALNGLVLSEEV
jgi:DNA (cytosine-5)-methyltransferase 1